MAQAPRYVGVNDNVNSFNVINHNNIFNVNAGIADEDNKIQGWLSPLEPYQRHQSVRTERLDGVGNWFLETDEFRRWRNSGDGCAQRVLFCSGGPGVGKTHLSSLVIDSLCDESMERDTGMAVAWLYCDFVAHQEQTAAHMLGALLKQLAKTGGIPEKIRQTFRKESAGRGLRLPNIVEMLKTTIALLPETCICIDALDESLPKHRQELLESLQDIVRESPRMRIFFTGRPHIQGQVEKYFPEAITMPFSPTSDDIRAFLDMKLYKDPEPEAMDNGLRSDILRIIPERISEIFLLVTLNIEAILGEMTIRQRRKKLQEMTKGKGLGDAYTATLARIKAQGGSKARLGMETLMWVSHSKRPLKVIELCHALGVEGGSTDLDPENIPAIETLLGCCLGLVTVEASSSTVRLVHFTLQGYLCNDSSPFNNPHSMLAEVCLTYLNFRRVQDLSPNLRTAPAETPFLRYASYYWATHARNETSDCVKSLALKFLCRSSGHISFTLLLLHEMDGWWYRFRQQGSSALDKFTGLHCAAYLGLVEIMSRLLETNEWDLSATDFEGNTALAWAARKGHAEIVKMLLERVDVHPDAGNNQGSTPLSQAAYEGQERVVKMLLQRADVNPGTANTYGQTPLFRAAWKGRERVVKMLLDRVDVDPETKNKHGSTPLSQAAYEGHAGVVKILLERADVNPNTADERGRTPLLKAASEGHEGIVKMLLERDDVNYSSKDKDGQTPLLGAACMGHERVVKMLLEQPDIDPEIQNKFGSTPLSQAAYEGHGATVKMLLEREDVNPNIKDEHGQTPLFKAAWKGRESVVKILLERADLDPDTGDKHGSTPLSSAASEGHEDVVKMLLERVDVNINTKDEHGQTPLFGAAWKGHKRVVKILLERANIDPEAGNKHGSTPLLQASYEGHEGVVKVLLKRVDVNPNTQDELGQTPLFTAAGKGHGGVVKMLLEQPDVDPNITNKYGSTPLSQAAHEGHEGIAGMLLERVDVNPNTKDEHGQTPLFGAAWKGHERLVEMLLGRPDVHPDIQNKYCSTPLSSAAHEGHEGTVKILLERMDVNPNSADDYGNTPLLHAASRGHEEIVKMLLAHEDINSDTVDISGHTPLSRALLNGHETIVKLLSKRKNPAPLLLYGQESAGPLPRDLSDVDQPSAKRLRKC